jgi:hypothetical protein
MIYDDILDFDILNDKNKKEYVNKLNDEDQIKLINSISYPNIFEFIDNPSENVQIAAVTYDGDNIEYIKNPSEYVQIAAVKNYPSAISCIKKPTEKVKLIAVRKNCITIRLINKPSEKLQIEAVKGMANYKNIARTDKYITSSKALELYEKLKIVKNII